MNKKKCFSLSLIIILLCMLPGCGTPINKVPENAVDLNQLDHLFFLHNNEQTVQFKSISQWRHITQTIQTLMPYFSLESYSTHRPTADQWAYALTVAYSNKNINKQTFYIYQNGILTDVGFYEITADQYTQVTQMYEQFSQYTEYPYHEAIMSKLF